MVIAMVCSAYSTGHCVSRCEDPKCVLTSRGTPRSHGTFSAPQSAGIRSPERLLFRLESWEGTVCTLESKVGHRVLTAYTWAYASYVQTLAPFSSGAKSHRAPQDEQTAL